jgi:hypothetical protein
MERIAFGEPPRPLSRALREMAADGVFLDRRHVTFR